MSETPASAGALPWGDGAYSIKRHGVTLLNCDSEPVQTPGCIQAHGALLVLRRADLVVLQASENSAQHLGLAPAQLLGQPVTVLLSEAQVLRLQQMLARESLDGNALYAFSLPALGAAQPLDVCVHTVAGVVVLEFEVGRAPSAEAGDPHFGQVSAAVKRLQASQGLQAFCQQLTAEVAQITGLDRVMVYKFHADLHGEVLAETRRADLPAWLGLHYPESDIPRPAREIFKRLWIRPLPDAAGPLVELLPLRNPDTGQPLDMTHCALRGASVMYTDYLANMGVAASLTMPILVAGELWGLVACHHMTATHFPHPLRAACELLAQVASLQLKSAEHNEQLSYRLRMASLHQQLVARVAQDGELSALVLQRPGLLDAIEADGVALFNRDRWWRAGLTPEPPQLDDLASWLLTQPALAEAVGPVFATESLARSYPAGADIAALASGVLAVRLSRNRRDMVVWFRQETARTLHWAGDPALSQQPAGPPGSRLSPRGSFALFIESVRHCARPWLAVELDAALQLRMMVMELVVSRAERLADLNLDLRRSNDELDAFAYVASHDLKEPLRGIHRYAHQLLETAQTLDAANRLRIDNLMRLAVRMDGLLDSLLHYSRVGRSQLDFEDTALDEVLDEALEMVSSRRAEHAAVIRRPRPLPSVLCDRVRVREVFSNLLSNALKYHRPGAPDIEIGYLAPGEAGLGAHAPPGAGQCLVLYVRDLGIGIEARHFEPIFRMFKRLHAASEFGGGVGAGLAIVQKLVQRHGGQVWLESVPGQGSSFYFTLAAPAQVAL